MGLLALVTLMPFFEKSLAGFTLRAEAAETATRAKSRNDFMAILYLSVLRKAFEHHGLLLIYTT